MGWFDDVSLDNLNDWLGDLAGVVGQGIGIYEDVSNAGDDDYDVNEPAIIPPVYSPNIAASDFAFTPNMYLIGFGLLLLVVVLFLRK